MKKYDKKTGGRPIPGPLEKKKMKDVTGYDYIGLEEEKQALLLRKVSKGAMFENLKLESKIRKKW